MLIKYFVLKAVYICTVFFLQDVVAAQQAVMQNLITYISDYNSMLQRVGELEVSSPYFVTVSQYISTVCDALSKHITFYVIYSNSDITSSKMSYTNSFFFSGVTNDLPWAGSE